MDSEQMVALDEVLNDDLPVDVPDLIVVCERLVAVEPVSTCVVGEATELARQGACLSIQGCVNESFPDLDPDLGQAQGFLTEVRYLFHVRRGEKRSVAPVGPRVVRAY